jgi:hypothetical protein
LEDQNSTLWRHMVMCVCECVREREIRSCSSFISKKLSFMCCVVTHVDFSDQREAAAGRGRGPRRREAGGIGI